MVDIRLCGCFVITVTAVVGWLDYIPHLRWRGVSAGVAKSYFRVRVLFWQSSSGALFSRVYQSEVIWSCEQHRVYCNFFSQIKQNVSSAAIATKSLFFNERLTRPFRLLPR